METGLDIKDPLIVPKDVNPGGGLDQNFRELSAGAGSDLFKVNKDGVFVGAETFSDAPFSVDFQGNVTLGDGTTIKSGQTDYNTGTGYWIGNDSGTPKFSIGNGSNKYVTWDGSALTIRGTLNADDITAGTLTGRTVKAKGTGVTTDVWLDGSVGQISFLYGGVEKAFIYTNSGGDVLFDADVDIALNPTGDLAIDPGGDTYITNGDLFVTDGEITANAYNDYAEMFEAIPEFADKKIPYGTTVVTEGEKIRPALHGESPIGVVSAMAAVILGSGQSYQGRYERDKYGKFVEEEAEMWVKKEDGKKTQRGFTDKVPAPEGSVLVTRKRKKERADYDPNRKYIPRKDRPEWNVIGLLGKVRITKGQPTDKRWVKLRDVSEDVEEWLIR